MRRDRLLVVRPSPDGRAGVTRLAAGGGAEYSQFADPRYAVLPPEARPCAESLKDVTVRLLPYWYDAIVPDLRTGACVLVVSHGNTLRALIKHLDRLSGEQIAELNIPTGIPLAFDLGPDMHPVIRGGRYLGPQPAGTLRSQGR